MNIMTRIQMWNHFVANGEWGLKGEFNKLSDADISRMTVDECILTCYMLLMGIDDSIADEIAEIDELLAVM